MAGVPGRGEDAATAGPVLVTGASGFVGLPLITELARSGAEVHAVHWRGAPPRVAGVRWHRADLLEDGEIELLLARVAPRRLVHLAWYAEPGRFWEAPENVIWVERSLGLLRAFARHGGRRAVMLGSCAEYDWTAVEGDLSESRSPVEPATLYGVAKDALRRVAESYAAQRGIELAWGRLFFLYGPREAPERLVASVARALLVGESVSTSVGHQLRDFMHVEDAAGALVALLESSVVGAVNIGSGVGVSVGDLIDELVRLTGRPELVRRGALAERDGEPARLVADVTRLREEVGYRLRWSLADGIAATVRWHAHQSAAQPVV